MQNLRLFENVSSTSNSVVKTKDFCQIKLRFDKLNFDESHFIHLCNLIPNQELEKLK